MEKLFILHGALRQGADVAAWFDHPDPLRLIARCWFDRMRACGDDVLELLHDGCPVACVHACVGLAPFGYVNAFKAHVNVGFFRGAWLPDPQGLLEGSGKRMRHVKLRPGVPLAESALEDLIRAAHAEIREQLG